MFIKEKATPHKSEHFLKANSISNLTNSSTMSNSTSNIPNYSVEQNNMNYRIDFPNMIARILAEQNNLNIISNNQQDLLTTIQQLQAGF